MSEYTISQVYPTDKTVLAQIDTLLGQEGIRRDGNLDYICAMFDEEYNVIGTGSCFGNTLRFFAVAVALSLVIGFLLNAFVPSIPLAAAFALLSELKLESVVEMCTRIADADAALCSGVEPQVCAG